MSGHKIGWFLKILFSYLLLTGILIACVGLPVIQNIRSLVREEILDSARIARSRRWASGSTAGAGAWTSTPGS